MAKASDIASLRAKAKRGDALALDALGTVYFNKRDYTEAVKWYLKGADRGNISSQATLVTQFAYGVGVKQNYEEAYFWLLVFFSHKVESTGFGEVTDLLEKNLNAARKSAIRKRVRAWLKDHPAPPSK
jgi:hypothetical protein